MINDLDSRRISINFNFRQADNIFRIFFSFPCSGTRCFSDRLNVKKKEKKNVCSLQGRILIYPEAEITPGNRAQCRIVRGQASALITDVPAFVDFHSSIPLCCLCCSPTVSVGTSVNLIRVCPRLLNARRGEKRISSHSASRPRSNNVYCAT